MAWEDVVGRLGEIATGWQVGTMEREQADRVERTRLIDQSINLGTRGVDYAPFFTPDNVRPGNIATLEQLQNQSGPQGPLQHPFEREREVAQATRQSDRAFQEHLTGLRLDASADATDTRIAAQAQRASGRRTNDLTAQHWDELRNIIRETIGPDIQAGMPSAFTVDERTGRQSVTNPQDIATMSAIMRGIEQRLPDTMPNNLRGIQQEVRRIWENDVRPGVTMTPSSLWNWQSRAFTYSDSGALPSRGQPASPGTGMVQQAQAAGGGVAGRLLERYRQPIRATAQESGLPENLIAATMAFENPRGEPTRQGPPVPDGGLPAVGLMQVRPDTYAETAARIGEVRGITDPEANIRVGGAYLRQMLDSSGGHVGIALAAYNWGPGHVERLINRMSRSSGGTAGQPANVSWSELEARLPGATRSYIRGIGDTLGGLTLDGSAFRSMSSDAWMRTRPAREPSPELNTVAPPRTGEVPQITPTPQHAPQMETFVQGLARMGQQHIMEQVDINARREARTSVIPRLVQSADRHYPMYREWVRSELERRLRSLR